MVNILIVEDEKNILRLFNDTIKGEGYNTFTATNGLEGLEILLKHHIDLAVVDIMMPKMDGIEFVKTLRNNNSSLPLLIVTAKNHPSDIKQGFLVGVDDYMTKPVDDEEMLLRIKALLRRAKIANEKKLEIGKIVLDYDNFTVEREGDVQTLAKKEFLLLFKLLSYPDKILTRVQLMDEIWGLDSESDEKTLNVHINKLRARFKDYDEFEIVTIRGLGYKAVRKI